MLASHNVEGMEGLMARFRQIVDEFTRKPYELLDYQKGQFDRDYLEFNANIHELESSLQGFINSSFENITSTEQALTMLKQFQAILQRESLKDDLDSKFMVRSPPTRRPPARPLARSPAHQPGSPCAQPVAHAAPMLSGAPRNPCLGFR